MSRTLRRETRKIVCPEEHRTNSISLEWDEGGSRSVLKSIRCDNPRLRDIDNWECEWSCWEEIAGEEEP
jgi:hypothetical protein